MRGFGFQQQQHCADEGMWVESQAQQQNYAFHEESWSSENNYQNQFPSMMHMNKHGAFGVDSKSKHHGMLGGNGNCGMFQEGMHSNHGFGHGGGKKFPFGGNKASHQFSNGGGRKFNSGGHHEYIMEESDYEEAYEEHVGAVNATVDEMRYERHGYQGGDSCYVNPYERKMIRNMNHKPHHWTAKGV